VSIIDRGSRQEPQQGPLSHAERVRVSRDPSPWRAVPVVELDATADKCLFLYEGTDERMCGHADDDPSCLVTRLHRHEDEAHRQAQLTFFGVALPCPECGTHAPCEHLEVDQ
jgi:hypothetical protein